MQKTKYLDKYHRNKDQFNQLTGESLLFERSTEKQADKRKRLSVAFYKEKMQTMLSTIIKMTAEQIEELKREINQGNTALDIVAFINTLIMRSI